MWERVKKTLPVLLLAVVGLGVSVLIESVHRRLAADVNYASFCNVSATVNCDVVLTSRYSSFAGISVAVWAMLYYAATAGLAIGIGSAGRARLRSTLSAALFASTAWGLLFSLYMGVVAFVLLHTVCLMCSALYLVNIALFVAAWRLRRSQRVVGRRQAGKHVGQDRVVLIGSVAVAAILLAVGSWEALGRGVRVTSVEDIARERPEFYHWYLAQPSVQVPLDANRHSRGSSAAPVTIVEFSDFECGHCAAFHRSLDDVLRRFGGQSVRVIFHHFPLDSSCNPKVTGQFHPQACLAAVAAECAGEQGKFWQYHNLLFDNQGRLERPFLISYAGRLGLDVTQFTACLGSEAPRARVERDAREGAQLGIDSTPTIFINGRTIKGALDTDLLTDALTLARAKR